MAGVVNRSGARRREATPTQTHKIPPISLKLRPRFIYLHLFLAFSSLPERMHGETRGSQMRRGNEEITFQGNEAPFPLKRLVCV